MLSRASFKNCDGEKFVIESLMSEMTLHAESAAPLKAFPMEFITLPTVFFTAPNAFPTVLPTEDAQSPMAETGDCPMGSIYLRGLYVRIKH